MGGKTKQSQRTKNNVRPSSSSRSAELLNSGLSLDGGFMTLGNGKPLPPLFPTLASANLEQGLNPEFQLCFKKLNKKDPITRAKALQELCELVNSGDVEDVIAALPSWAHFYKILTADTDRKVREATQVCHGGIMRVCGRRTAPQLKALLPPWLQAQYDEHAPAQTQAHKSLTCTFPDSKLPEVISFCKVEVMSHLLDNLLGNTEAILAKRVENKEERELQMNRIIISSLQGLEYFTLHLPSAHDAWLWAALTPLLQAKAFWKFAQSTPQVRAAWYGALGRLASRFGGAFGALYAARAFRALLGGAPGPGPASAPGPASGPAPAPAPAAAPMWGCLLQLMHSVPEWHTYLDKKELLVKRILDLLENGGWGDAKHLSNMLLPLLAYLPQDLLTKDFYRAFFNATFTGLEKKNILNSKSERQSWITSLAECLRYMSIQKNDFVLEITTSVHRTWLEKVLSSVHDGQTKTNLIKCSATNMSSLVKYWLKQSKEENSEKYDQLVRNFWQNVSSTVLTQIDKAGTEQKEIGNLIDGHILFLQTLKTTFSQEPKKQQSIKFHGDEETVPEKCDVAPEQCDASIVERYNHNLDDSVQKICCHYFESAEQKQVSNTILTPLITLLVEFDSRKLFTTMSRQFDVDSIYKFYDKVLRTWLSGDTMRCKAVVDIVFLLMKYMSEAEQDSMFGSFTQFPPPVVEWCLSVCVRQPYVRGGAARRWLAGAEAAAVLRRLAGRAALQAEPAARALLLVCLAEPLASARGLADVLCAVAQAVSAPPVPPVLPAAADHLEAAGSLAARLATSLATPLQDVVAPHYAHLVLQLFRLNVLVPRGDSRLSVETWCEVRSSWQDGVAALPDADRKHFLCQSTAFLQEQLFQNIEKLDITKIENITSPCPYLFNRSDDAEEPNDITEVVAFTKQIFDINNTEAAIVESYALRYECVTSQLNCLYDDGSDVMALVIRDASKSDVKELTKRDLMLYVNKYLFRAIYLRTMLLHKISSNEDEDEPSEQKTWCNVLLKDEYLENEFCKVLHDYDVINSLHEGYAFWAHYDIIVQTKQKSESLVADVTSAMSEHTADTVRRALDHRARAAGKHWALAAARHTPHTPHSPHTPHTPAAPAEPAQPAGPDEPAKPAGPAEPAKPAGPAEPAKPAGPAEPAKPAGPAEPAKPAGPAEPAKLAGPAEPAEHADPVMPLLDNDGQEANGFFHSLQASTRWSADEDAAYKVKLVLMVRSWSGAYGAPPHPPAVSATSTRCYFDFIIDAYFSRPDTMLYDMDISTAEWCPVVSNVAVVEFLTHMVTSRGWNMPAHQWDFVTISLCSLLASARKSMNCWASTKVSMLCRAVLRLWAAVRGFVRGVGGRCEREEPAPHVAGLTEEWRDVFAPDATYSLLSIIMHVLDTCAESEMTSTQIEVLDELIKCTKLIEWDTLPAAHKLGALSLTRLALCAADALQQPAHHAHKYLAYYLLLALAKPLVLDDAEKLSLWSDENSCEGEDEKVRPQFCLEYFHNAFTHLHEIVEAALSTVVLGEGTCEFVAMSDSYSMALGWLLLADVLDTLGQLARGDLTHHYVEIYRERKYAELILGSALRLLPDGVFAYAADNTGTTLALPHYTQMFLEVKNFSVHETAEGSVCALACRAACGAVCGAGGAGARAWWRAASPRAARLLERLVAAYVTPHAARQQLRRLHERAHRLDDTEVRIAWSCHEVTCVYTVEERRLELRVWLSSSHPLSPPRLATSHTQGPGSNTHWLALYLAYQNGSLLNALKMWTSSVNAKVEKAPQCYICYCRLHPSSGRLPRVACHQCRNRFHTLCLRKWFATSNKSSCPLCRAAF